MNNRSTLLVAFIAFFLLTGFFGPDGDNPDEQRQTIQTMKQETLKKLYQYHPAAEKKGGQLDWLCRVQ